MNRNQFLDALVNREVFLKNLIKKLTGSFDENRQLYIRKQHGFLRYYKGDKYLGDDNLDTIRDLCQQEYCCKLFSTAEDELKTVRKCIAVLKRSSADISSFFEQLPEIIRKHVKPELVGYKNLVSAFQESMAKRPRMYMNYDEGIKTERGDLVRSKSEVIIANMLYQREIPYEYEVRTYINNQVRYPDFTVLNKRTGKIYLWEHLGMMDDPAYCARNQIKVEEYAAAGYIPGDNLILTFESSTVTLNTHYICCIIDHYLK